MKHTVVLVQAVGSQLKGISRPQGKTVTTVFVEVLPLPKASEARAFSKSGYVLINHSLMPSEWSLIKKVGSRLSERGGEILKSQYKM
jgi:hypothetical protein